MLQINQLIGFGVGGAGPFIANAVNFDGSTTYLLRGADLTGNADSKLWTGSVWFKRAATGVLQVLTNTANNNALFRFSASDTFQIIARNTSATIILNVESSAITDTASWHSAMFSVDMADTGKRHLLIDGVSDLATITTYTNDTIDFTDTDYSVGASVAGTSKVNGDLSEFWSAPGVYVDLSVTANEEKFRTALGKPEDLGSDGSTPTGTPPLMFFSDATAAWHTNKATGGGFTENGALTTAATSPSD